MRKVGREEGGASKEGRKGEAGMLATWAAYFAYYNRNFREFSTFDRIIVYVVRPDAPAARLAPSGGILGRVLPRAIACFARVL
jgi:hypothetical protein